MSQSRTRWNGETIREVVKLLESGLTCAEIEERTGVPQLTVRNYKCGRLPRRALLALADGILCPECGEFEHRFDEVPDDVYAYLLGVYLGDGMLSTNASSPTLRVFLDLAYPNIISEVRASIAKIRGRVPGVVPMSRGANGVIVYSYWKQWPCYFPQHGPGKKHERKIELTDWQQALVHEAPGQFLRGLIHTDGWRGVNKVHSKGKDYAYPRYQFSNRSDDIRKLFTDTCDSLGIAWRQWTRWHISVARHEAVTRLNEFVGPKT